MNVKARLTQLWDGGTPDSPVRKQDLLDLAAIIDSELAKLAGTIGVVRQDAGELVKKYGWTDDGDRFSDVREDYERLKSDVEENRT